MVVSLIKKKRYNKKKNYERYENLSSVWEKVKDDVMQKDIKNFEF